MEFYKNTESIKFQWFITYFLYVSIILLSRFIERYLYEKKVMFFLEHLEGGGAEKVAVDVLNKIDKKNIILP